MSLTARDLMQAPARTVDPDLPLAELERAFLAHRVTGFPVVDDGKLVGIVTRSDIVRQLSVEQSLGETLADYGREYEAPGSIVVETVARHVGERMGTLHVRDLMHADVITVAPGDSLEEVARTICEKRVHRVPVVDDGVVLGIISSVDFVRLFALNRAQAS